MWLKGVCVFAACLVGMAGTCFLSLHLYQMMEESEVELPVVAQLIGAEQAGSEAAGDSIKFGEAVSVATANGTSEQLANVAPTSRPMEFLDRSLVALDLKNEVFLSWRMLGTDPPDIGFHLYRNGEQINAEPLTASTNYIDKEGSVDDKYAVAALGIGGREEKSVEVAVWKRQGASAESVANRRKPAVPYLEIPLAEPPSDKHIPGDMSVGDLDGDGRYDLVFEWEGPEPWLEAIDLDGNQLWRIRCGPNVTKNKLALLVYDFDGDGMAEVACKTGPGTKDGTGKFLSLGPAATDDDSVIVERARYKSRPTHLLEDKAYITVFNGRSGKELATVQYNPLIGPRDQIKASWDDSHGYRASSIKAAVMYHKEHGPLLVFTRGIYSRIAMNAYRFDGEQLHDVWSFDTKDNPDYDGYRGMGNHSVAVGDVDNDGSDELIYGACAIDHDGTGLYTTGMGHGDSHALTDHLPDRPGLEFYQGHENRTYGISMRDAGTGEIIWEVRSQSDVGRAWAADVNPKYRGSEITSVATKNLDCYGNEIDTNYNPYMQPIYFDGDVQRDLRAGERIDDGSGDLGRILTGWYYGASTIHSTKNDVNLVADIIGDWREEMVCKRNDNKALLIFTTWIPTERKNYTLMHDPVYRMNVAVQNIGYNQPAHVGYYFADGAPKPNIRLIGGN
ncbi:Rhamnogalacturonan endolyase YesW precursor [Calycomorphotria hydatis]|uniref:Rhamnogalacturonan endolyase YesW n=2 Tax=Calycomorphotria hydatis TaxID=2528027 RepID=A0A517TA18_9PLAN|nr:Rhamnogalacturonan endolyase YesW precursor [Calycomorphotria hydatis]